MPVTASHGHSLKDVILLPLLCPTAWDALQAAPGRGSCLPQGVAPARGLSASYLVELGAFTAGCTFTVS